MFDHEKLDVYKVAMAFRCDVEAVLATCMVGRRDMADQLQRASSSIVLNIAEGAGRFHPLDKRKSYLVSLGSATECASIYEILFNIGTIDSTAYFKAREKLGRIVSMLTTLAKTLQIRSGKKDLVVKRSGKRE